MLAGSQSPLHGPAFLQHHRDVAEGGEARQTGLLQQHELDNCRWETADVVGRRQVGAAKQGDPSGDGVLDALEMAVGGGSGVGDVASPKPLARIHGSQRVTTNVGVK
jgi:hypothetical protein